MNVLLVRNVEYYSVQYRALDYIFILWRKTYF